MPKIKNLIKNKWVRLLTLLTLFSVYCVLMTLFVGTACPFSLLTGLPCPACGMTRANILALRLEFAEAFAMHPLFFASYIVFAAVIVFTAKPEWQNKLAVEISCWVLIAAFIGVYIYRMIAVYPDTPPMQYNYDSLFGLIRIRFNF